MQKFKNGDLVRVAKDLASSMAHFQSDCNAIVIESCGGENAKEYGLFIEGSGESYWYYEHQLSFVRHAPELLETWKDQAEAAHLQRTNLRWILDNWETIIKRPAYDTMLKVMELLDVPTSFHRNGEYYCLENDWCRHLPFIDFIMAKRSFRDAFPGVPEEAGDSEIIAFRERCWQKLEKELQAVSK